MSKSNSINYHKTSWRKSSRSIAQTNCIEVAISAGSIGIRDSRNPTGTVLTFSPPTQWTNFIHQIKTQNSVCDVD